MSFIAFSLANALVQPLPSPLTLANTNIPIVFRVKYTFHVALKVFYLPKRGIVDKFNYNSRLKLEYK